MPQKMKYDEDYKFHMELENQKWIQRTNQAMVTLHDVQPAQYDLSHSKPPSGRPTRSTPGHVTVNAEENHAWKPLSIRQRPSSASDRNQQKNNTLVQPRPKSANIPRMKFHVFGVGYREKKDEIDRRFEKLTIDTLSSKYDIIDGVPNVPPSSPKYASDLNTQDMNIHDMHYNEQDMNTQHQHTQQSTDITRTSTNNNFTQDMNIHGYGDIREDMGIHDDDVAEIPRHQFHLQLPVVSDDDDDDDDLSTDRLLEMAKSNVKNRSMIQSSQSDHDIILNQQTLQSEGNLRDGTVFPANTASNRRENTTDETESYREQDDDDKYEILQSENSYVTFNGSNLSTSQIHRNTTDTGKHVYTSYDDITNDNHNTNYDDIDNDVKVNYRLMNLCHSCVDNNNKHHVQTDKFADHNNLKCYSDNNINEVFNEHIRSRSYDNIVEMDVYHDDVIKPKGPIERGSLNLCKTGVHFREERNKIFNITPRNKGRKIGKCPVQRPKSRDSRLISDEDYRLAMDICRMPLKSRDTDDHDLIEKSKSVIKKTHGKVETLLSAVKRGSTDEFGELMSANQNYRSVGDTKHINRDYGDDGEIRHEDNRDKNYCGRCNGGIANMNVNNGNNNTHTKIVVAGEKNSRIGKNENDKDITEHLMINSLEKHKYDPKPITQQDTKVTSGGERNYYDIARTSSAKVKEYNKVNSKKNVSVRPKSPSNEMDILDCLHTQRLLKDTMRKISANRIQAWSKPVDTNIETQERQSILRKSPKPPATPNTKSDQPKAAPPPTDSVMTPINKTTHNHVTTSTVEENTPVNGKKVLDDMSVKTCVEQLEITLSSSFNRSSHIKLKNLLDKSPDKPAVNSCGSNHALRISDKRNKDPMKSYSTSFLDMAKIYAPSSATVNKGRNQTKARPNTAHTTSRRRTVSDQTLHLTTKQPTQLDPDTPGLEECKTIQDHLEQKGIDLDLKILQRALLPPTGTTLHFELKNKLPKNSHTGLLSNPKTWLPAEHKNLQRYTNLLKKYDEQKAREARGRKLPKRPQSGKKIRQSNKTLFVTTKRPSSAKV